MERIGLDMRNDRTVIVDFRMKIIYQSSMPRAGSTLLQNILAQNPDFYCTPTSGLLDLVFAARLAYSNVEEFRAQDAIQMRKAFLGFCRWGMEGYCQSLTDKPYFIDKSRGWGIFHELLTEMFHEEPKTICMVRDLKAILSSLEKKFRENPDKNKAIENQITLQGTTTLKRAIYNLSNHPLGAALDRIKDIHTREIYKSMLFVRFEDLTTNPGKALQRIYKYLGLPAYDHDFKNVEQVTKEDDNIYGIPGLHDVRPAVAPVPNDSERILGPDVINLVNQNYHWYQQLFGYET